MANGWKNFELQGTLFPEPSNAILDSRETVWEARPGASYTFRRITTAQFHVTCSTVSLFSEDAPIDAFLSQTNLTAPTVSVGLPDGGTATTSLIAPSGIPWHIERISEQHNGDGTSVVTVIVTDRTDFPA